MKRQICLAVSILPILLAYTVPVFGDHSYQDLINFFDAVFENGKVSMNWQISGQYETPTEIDYYAIERKHATNSYIVIGGVNEEDGNTGIREYSFEDEHLPSESIIQYRLKIVFKDGTQAYSQAKNIFLQNLIELQLTPSPFKESLRVFLPHELSSPYRIRIYNIKGEEVFKTEVMGTKETYIQLDLDTSGLLPGVYIFNLVSGSDSWQEKIIKQ